MDGMPNFGFMETGEHSSAFDELEIENALKHYEEDVPKPPSQDGDMDQEDISLLDKIYDHNPPQEAFKKVYPPNYPIKTHPFLWMKWVNENIMRGFGLVATSSSYVDQQFHHDEDNFLNANERIAELENRLKLAEEGMRSTIKDRDEALLDNIETNTSMEVTQNYETSTQLALEEIEAKLKSVKAERDSLTRELKAKQDLKYTDVDMHKRFMEGVTSLTRCYYHVHPDVEENWPAIQEAMRTGKWRGKRPGEY